MNDETKKIKIMERSIYSARLFIEVQHLLKKIDESEYKILTELYETLTENIDLNIDLIGNFFLFKPQVYIYIY